MAIPRFTRSVVAAAALFVCGLLVTPSSFADSYARIVRLSDIDGTVDIDRHNGNGFEKALQNMPITQGARLRTGSSGRTEVEFENGSVIRLVGDSSVEFDQLSLRTSGERLSEMRVADGTVYVDFRHKGGESFRVMAGGRSFDLTHDARFRMRIDGGQAELAVFKGEVDVQDVPQISKVKKNQTLTVDLNDSAKFALAKEISPLATDEYDRERAQYLDQYASSRHGSPYAYGYSDLYRYGTFFDAPGYGLVWQPASAGLGWDPFSSGYWSYYPGAGNVWISSYPWGWTPYRYGQWTFINGRGWCWRPGGWNQWNSGVVVTNPPPRWTRPIPPASGVVGTAPVGNPVQVRNIPTNLGPRRIGRMTPEQAKTGAQRVPATAVVPTNTAAPASANAAQSKSVNSPPARMNHGMDADPGMHRGGQMGSPASAPARQMSQPSAPRPTIEPSRPMAAPPAAHGSPRKGS
jgi:FecR protein